MMPGGAGLEPRMGGMDLLPGFRRAALVSRGYSPLTIEKMDQNVSRFLRWLDIDVSPFEIDDGMIERYLAYLLTTNARYSTRRRSPSTVRTYLKHLRAFYAWATDAGLTDHDPTEGIRGPKEPDRIIEPIDPASVALLLTVRHGRTPLMVAENQAIIAMLYDTGLRRSELLNLDRADVEARDHITLVGKGGRERSVAISAPIRDRLNLYLALRQDSSPALWVDQDGERLSAVAWRGRLKRLAMQLELKGISTHGLRRSAATAAVENGLAHTFLKEVFGWKKDSTAARYVHAAGRRMALAEQAKRSNITALLGGVRSEQAIQSARKYSPVKAVK